MSRLHCKFMTPIPKPRLKIPTMAFEPRLWGTLPQELLYLIFSCLPIAGIGRLRVLSKEWKRNIDCKSSDFNQVLNVTTHLNTFSLLGRSRSKWLGYIYDVQANQWHVYEPDALVDTRIAAHGGLVSLLSKWWWQDDEEPTFCYVMNPLTKQKTQLPPLLCMVAKESKTSVTAVRMVNLIVDRKTNEYKVFVVSSTRDVYSNIGHSAQVYDSYTKRWTVVEATQGHIIWWDIDLWPLGYIIVYLCADGRIEHFTVTEIARGLKVERGCQVLIEDHLFVLHEEASQDHIDLLEDGASMPLKYCISEFYLQEKSTAWVKLREHDCGPCECFHDTQENIMDLELFGCSGFLLVCHCYSKRSWLYNLTTCEWRTLPSFEKDLLLQMMCTTSWSAFG